MKLVVLKSFYSPLKCKYALKHELTPLSSLIVSKFGYNEKILCGLNCINCKTKIYRYLYVKIIYIYQSSNLSSNQIAIVTEISDGWLKIVNFIILATGNFQICSLRSTWK